MNVREGDTLLHTHEVEQGGDFNKMAFGSLWQETSEIVKIERVVVSFFALLCQTGHRT